MSKFLFDGIKCRPLGSMGMSFHNDQEIPALLWGFSPVENCGLGVSVLTTGQERPSNYVLAPTCGQTPARRKVNVDHWESCFIYVTCRNAFRVQINTQTGLVVHVTFCPVWQLATIHTARTLWLKVAQTTHPNSTATEIALRILFEKSGVTSTYSKKQKM